MKAGGLFIIVIGACIALPCAAFGQAPPPPPGGGTYPGAGPAAPAARQGIVAKGVKLALNAGSIHGDTDAIDDEQGRRYGFGAGAYVVYALNLNLSAQLELLYMQKGTTFDSGDTTLKFDYLEVPVLGRYEMGQPGGTRPYLVGGLSLALNVVHEVDDDGDVEDLECVSSTDVLVNLGAGATIPSGNGGISLEARVSVGMLNTVEDDPDNGCTGDADLKNNVVTIFAGYEF